MSVRLVTLYSTFAAIAIAANIGAQWAVISIYSGPSPIVLSMVVGTGVGLVLKYLLDKAYVFRYRASSGAAEATTFLLYSLMGLLTTAIFWGVELAFHLIFETDAMRYVGGVLGLALGYWIKYRLDARFVFARVST